MDEEEIVVNEDKDEFAGIEIVEENEFGDIEEDEELLVDERQDDVPQREEREDEVAALRREIDGLRNNLVQQAPQVADGVRHWEQRQEELLDQQKALQLEYQTYLDTSTLTSEKHHEVDAKARKLQKELLDVSAKKATAEHSVSQQAQHYQRLYGDVQRNPRAVQYAKAEYDRMVAIGHQPNEDTIDKAMNSARIQFKMSKGTPTNKDKAQLMGTNGDGRRGRPVNNSVKFDKHTTVMANELFLDAAGGDPHKAKQLFAKRVILPARKRDAKARRGR